MTATQDQKPWLIASALLAGWPDAADAVADEIQASVGALQAYIATGTGLSLPQLAALSRVLLIGTDDSGDHVATGPYLLRPRSPEQVRDLWRFIAFDHDESFAYELQPPRPYAAEHIVAVSGRSGLSVLLLPRVRHQLTNEYLVAMPGLSQELVPMGDTHATILHAIDEATKPLLRKAALAVLADLIEHAIDLHEFPAEQ